MLKMKNKCEKCGQALAQTDLAYICSYECTFCESCTTEIKNTCPNCNGDLVKRPTRTRGVVDVATSHVRKKIFGA